jgi:DNA-binding transcriptional regulator YbjK
MTYIFDGINSKMTYTFDGINNKMTYTFDGINNKMTYIFDGINNKMIYTFDGINNKMAGAINRFFCQLKQNKNNILNCWFLYTRFNRYFFLFHFLFIFI